MPVLVFFIGAIFGCAVGIIVMCLITTSKLNYNRPEWCLGCKYSGFLDGLPYCHKVYTYVLDTYNKPDWCSEGNEGKREKLNH